MTTLIVHPISDVKNASILFSFHPATKAGPDGTSLNGLPLKAFRLYGVGTISWINGKKRKPRQTSGPAGLISEQTTNIGFAGEVGPLFER